MLVSRVYKFRLEPTPLQEKYLLRAAMGCRYIYNLGLQQRNLVREDNLPSLTELYHQRLLALQQQKAAPQAHQKIARQSSLGSDQNHLQKPIQHRVTGQAQSKELTVLRRQVDWLQEIPFSCLQNDLVVDLHQAFQHFYRRAQNGERIQGAAKNPLGYPVPRRKSHLSILWKPNDVSIRSLSKACGGKDYFSYIRMPKCPGLMKMRQDRPIPVESKIGQKRVIQESDGHWFIGFTVEENVDWQLAEEDIGFVTLGGGSPVGVHDGTAYPLTEKQEKTWALIEDLDQKIKKRRRQLSRKEKFSENWKKQRQQISKLQHKRAAALKSMRHEITSQLASRFRSLVVTDLRRLTASAQSIEPSLGVADFLKQLSYKMHWRGGELNFAHTPELLYSCSQCGSTQTSIRGISEALCCKVCGFESPLEANVAQNLIKLYEGGELAEHVQA